MVAKNTDVKATAVEIDTDDGPQLVGGLFAEDDDGGAAQLSSERSDEQRTFSGYSDE